MQPTPRTTKPRRSWLLGIVLDDHRFEKALKSCADVVTLDLEDAVTAENKARARARIVELLGKERRSLAGREAWVRVNELFSPWGVEDLDTIARLDVDGITYPMVRGAEEVWEVRRVLDAHGGRAMLKLIIETPQALMNLNDIVRVPGVDFLNHGAGDLCAETGISSSDTASLDVTAVQTVIAARAYGMQVTEGVHIDNWRDDDSVRAFVRHARMQGFDALESFYPPHMPIINEVFTPTPQEVEQATREIAAFEAARKEGRPATVLDGKAIAVHEYEKAKKLLRYVEGLGEQR